MGRIQYGTPTLRELVEAHVKGVAGKDAEVVALHLVARKDFLPSMDYDVFCDLVVYVRGGGHPICWRGTLRQAETTGFLAVHLFEGFYSNEGESAAAVYNERVISLARKATI